MGEEERILSTSLLLSNATCDRIVGIQAELGLAGQQCHRGHLHNKLSWTRGNLTGFFLILSCAW